MTDKKSKKRNKLLIIPGVILCVIIIILAVAWLIVRSYLTKVNYVPDSSFTVNPHIEIPTDDPEESYGEELTGEQVEELRSGIYENLLKEGIYNDEGVFNVLIMGSDARKPGERARSDVMVLMSVNKNTKEISVISLMRDIYVYIPDCGYNRLNAANVFGGPPLLLDTIEQNFKIGLDKYMEIDFDSFIELVDAVGGVTVKVEDKDLNMINKIVRGVNRQLGIDVGDGVLKTGGLLNLNGKQALGFVRNRSYADGDFTRTGHQREVIEQLISKALDMSISEIDGLLDEFLPSITTNMTELELMSLIVNMPSYKNYGVNQIGVPVSGSYSGAMINGMSILQIDFEKNITAITDAIYGEGQN